MKFRSKKEKEFADNLKELGVNYEYEPLASRIRYTIPESGHLYTPDFVVRRPDGKDFIIEYKGIWDYNDRYKHYLIKQQYPDIDIRFVFQRAGQRIRKGSKTTYRDICEGRGRGVFKGITWEYGDGSAPREWFE